MSGTHTAQPREAPRLTFVIRAGSGTTGVSIRNVATGERVEVGSLRLATAQLERWIEQVNKANDPEMTEMAPEIANRERRTS